MRNKIVLKIILFILAFIPIKAYALDGDYYVVSKLDNNMAIDVAGGIAKESANVQLYTSHGGQNQKWKFIYNEEDYYKILSTQNNEYCLSIDQSYLRSNIKLSRCNDTDNQKWILEKDTDGYYKILDYSREYVVDIAGAKPNVKANIQLFTNNDNANQRFALNKEVEGTKTIEDGIYTISTNNLYMNVNNNTIENRVKINFIDANDTKNQKWKITYLNNGLYQISSLMDKNYSLDIPGGKKAPYTNIQMFKNNYGINQQWIIKDNGNGTYQIISKVNGFNLESSTEFSYVNEENNQNNQSFKFELTSSIEEAIVPDGVYIITSKVKSDMVLDVDKGSAKYNTNIQLYKLSYSNNQQWDFIRNEDGYYNIKSKLNSDYCLSVSSSSFTPRNNIVLKECNNLAEQRWRLTRDNEGYYKIISNNEEFLLDVAGARSTNGTNIQLFDDVNSIAQKFTLNRYIEGEKTIDSGVYTITSSNGNNLNIDGNINNKTNINIDTPNDSNNQKFIITYLDNGYYKIETTTKRNYLLDVAGARKVGNTNIQIFQSNSGYNQQWIIKDNGDETYKIISRLNGMNLDVATSNVVVNEENNSITQNFKINKVSIGTKTIEDGYYFIDSKINSKKSIDVAGGIAEENKNVQIFSANSGLNQKWHFEYLGDGYYKILSNIDEDYALTMSANNNIQINKYDNLDTQKWSVIKNDDNSYSIINVSLKALSLHNSNTENKTNILAEDIYYNNNQKFIITKTVEGKTVNNFENGYYTISSSIDNDFVIDVAGGKNENNTNIQIFTSNSKKNQKWYFEYHNSYYIIKSGLDDSKVLTVDSGSNNVKLYSQNNSYNQQWVIKEKDGNYILASNSNGLYMSISENRVENKLNIQTADYDNLESQIFRISKTRLENIVIDISSHNGTVDWDRIKNDGQVYGVILRVAAGSYSIDSKLEQNVSALNRLKIPYGIYIYSYAEDQVGTVPDLGTSHEAKLEALRMVNAIKNFNINPTLGIYYDLEVWENGNNSNWTSANYEPLINNFHEVMNENGYGDWKIYANLSMANSSLYPWRERITWIAQWNDHCTYTSFYNLWQYTSDGHVDGVNTRVDMNIYYID